jgi:hypothetical protein
MSTQNGIVRIPVNWQKLLKITVYDIENIEK